MKTYHSKIIDNFLKKDNMAIDIPIYIGKIFKFIIFKKILKEDKNGRCIKCDARNLCGVKFKCRCNMEQQYKTRKFIKYIIK